jgi:hypothetical protein
VEGKELIPVREYLGEVGLEGNLQSYAAELWITLKDSPSAREQAILRNIIRSRKNK